MKLTEYNEADTFDEGDILVKDGDLGTMKIPIEKVVEYLSETIKPTVIFEDPEGYATNITEKMNEAEAIFTAAMSAEEHVYEKTYSVTTPMSQFTFNPTGYTYGSGDRFEVYVNGLKLDSSAYSNNSNVITIDAGVSGDGNPDIVEIVCYVQDTATVDTTLSLPGVPADSKSTGDALKNSIAPAYSASSTYSEGDYVLYDNKLYRAKQDISTAEAWTAAHWEPALLTKDVAELKDDLSHIGLSDSVKVALLNCFDNVAWKNGDGREYHDILEAALYEEEYPRITAVFAPGSHVVYTDDALSTLTPYLTVKLFEDVSDTGTVIPSTDYTLSGTLVEGQSVVRVSYNDLSTTFTLTAVDFYNQAVWKFTDDALEMIEATIASATGYGPVINFSQGDKRKSFVVGRGKKPMVDSVNHQDTIYYPIPVPSWAKKVTVNVTPNTQFLGVGTRTYVNGEYSNTTSQYVGWVEGEAVIELTEMQDERFLTITTKYDSSGTSYPVPPNEVSVVYSEE